MTDISGTTNPVAKFDLFSGILKAGGGGDEPLTLSGTASSTVEDLHGDNIQRAGLKDMERQVDGMTIFRNHSYGIPEDIMGTATRGKVVKRGDDSDGNAVWDFDIDMRINDANPKAIEAWEAIKKGTKLGFSIGANIPDGQVDVDRKTGAKTIKRIQLLETSIVGIPANPRSWISRAVEFIDMAEADVVPEEVKDAPPADDRAELEWTEADGPAEVSEDITPDEQEQPETDSPSDADDSDADPVLLEEAPEEGEAPLEGDTVEVEPAISEEAELTSHLTDSVSLLNQTVAEMKTARRERDEALEHLAEAERERDEAVQTAHDVLVQVGAAVNQIKQTPVGRKTQFREGSENLAIVERIYGPDLVKMMENHRDE